MTPQLQVIARDDLAMASPVVDRGHGQMALLAGQTPRSGKSNAEFTRRITGAALELSPLLARRPLRLGSHGVARVLGEACGLPDRVDLDNGAMGRFDPTAVPDPEPAWETS